MSDCGCTDHRCDCEDLDGRPYEETACFEDAVHLCVNCRHDVDADTCDAGAGLD